MIQRMIDNLPRLINYDYFQAIIRTLQPTLVNKFGTGSEDPMERARSYLQEDVEVAAERAKLETAKDRLDQVLKALTDFHLQSA